MKIKVKQKDEHSMFSNMMFFMSLLFKASPLLVIGELIWGVMNNLPSTLISVLGIKYVIDIAASGERLNRIYYVVLVCAGLLIISKLICFLYREFFWNVQKEIAYFNLNRQLYEKAKSLDLESYDNPDFYNNFILTIESSSDNIQNLLGLVRRYFANVVSLLTVSSILLTIDPLCLVIILGTILIFLPISHIISDLQVERRIENTKYHRRSDYFQRIFYLQDYAKEVRMNNIHPLLISRYNDAADDVIANQKKYWTKIPRLYFIQEMGVQIVGFMFVLPLYLGYLVLVKKTITPGDFVASFNSAYSIAISINFLTVWGVAQFGERAKLIEKYRGFLKSDFKIKDGKDVAKIREPKEIKIENLSFTYPGNDEPTLKNINLTIKPYEKIALVGFNGAGKTTLTNLLLRLYDSTSGSIKIDGKNINDVTIQSHRNRFAAVFQDFQPLSHGVNTELLREFDDEGVMLSGGESQKVAIARAFYKKCPYVILDEPSANLDPVAEYNLNQAMLDAAKDKTVIFISHRLSTTVDADKIYVMENGEIIESGSHDELMKLNKTYAYMFNLQAEKYKN